MRFFLFFLLAPIGWIYDLLYYLRIVKALERRAKYIQALAKGIADSRIRYRFDFPLPGEEEIRDSMLSNVIDAFFGCDAETRTVIPEDESTKILQWLESDPSSGEDRKTYLRVSYWLAEKTGEKNRAHVAASAYQSLYSESMKSMDGADIVKTCSKFEKRYRAELKTFRNSKAQRYDLRLEELTPLLPWFSLFFLLAGYTYTRSVYGYFGVDVSNFFSMSDYLAVSIEEITNCFAIFIGILIGALLEHRSEKTRTEYEIRDTSVGQLLSYCFKYLFCLFILYHMYKGTFPLEFVKMFGPLPVMIVASLPIYFIAARYFKNPRYLSIVLLSLVGFFSGIHLNSKMSIKNIKEGHSGMTFEIKAESREFTQENFSFIGGNSRYIFLHSKEGSVEIVPIESAERIKISTAKKLSDLENKSK